MTIFEYESNNDVPLKLRYLNAQLWLCEKFGSLTFNAGWDVDAPKDGTYIHEYVRDEFKQRFPNDDELLFVKTAKAGDIQIWYIDKRIRKELDSGNKHTQVFLTNRVYQVKVSIPDDIEAVEFRLAMS